MNNNATAVQATTPRCARWPSSGFESRFDAGKAGPATTISVTGNAFASEVRRWPSADNNLQQENS
jgi:hypothetical protein